MADEGFQLQVVEPRHVCAGCTSLRTHCDCCFFVSDGCVVNCIKHLLAHPDSVSLQLILIAISALEALAHGSPKVSDHTPIIILFQSIYFLSYDGHCKTLLACLCRYA